MNTEAQMATITASFVMSFVLTNLLASRLVIYMKARGWTGTDIHKPSRIECAEPGGIIILLSLIPSFTLLYLGGFLNGDSIGAVLTIVMTGGVGLLDDIVNLRQRQKVVLAIIAGLPLALSYSGSTIVKLPTIGDIELGQILYMLFIPFAVAVASNLTNMLAGFNGLEAGFGSIACGMLGLVCLLSSSWDAALLSFVSLGALLAFLVYNWYPARTFPGDTGTLMFGAIVASVSILGKLEFVGASILMPAILDFVLKMAHRDPFSQRRIFGDTRVNEKGFLVPPSYPAFVHAFMRVSPTSEKQLVLLILITEFAFFVASIFLVLLF